MENLSNFESKFTLDTSITVEDAISQLADALGLNDEQIKAKCPQFNHLSYRDCTVTINKHPRWDNSIMVNFWEKGKKKHVVSVTQTGEFWD